MQEELPHDARHTVAEKHFPDEVAGWRIKKLPCLYGERFYLVMVRQRSRRYRWHWSFENALKHAQRWERLQQKADQPQS